MELKNIIAAISLSAAVIVLYSILFSPTQEQINSVNDEAKKEITQNLDAPTIDEKIEVKTVTREDALEKDNRILFENENIKGSISLKGALIDDLEFKKFKKEKNGLENVTLLNPKYIEDGYYAETGWATTNKNIDLPNQNSIWKIVGNDRLSPNNPIKLLWTNDQGIEFQKDIIIDNK